MTAAPPVLIVDRPCPRGAHRRRPRRHRDRRRRRPGAPARRAGRGARRAAPSSASASPAGSTRRCGRARSWWRAASAGGGAWPSHPGILRLWIERLERSGEHLTDADPRRGRCAARRADGKSGRAGGHRRGGGRHGIACRGGVRGRAPACRSRRSASSAIRPSGACRLSPLKRCARTARSITPRSCAALRHGRRSSRPCRASPATPGRPSRA